MRKKIMIASGSYTDNAGQTKTIWQEVGVIMTSQAGKEFALLNPVINLAGFPREPGKDMIIASIFEDKPKEHGYSSSNGTNNPSSQQHAQYNQQQNPPIAQHLPNQNANTSGNGYPPAETYYDASGNPLPI